MSRFDPAYPGFAERVRASFARQPAMATIGARLGRVEAGEVEVILPVAAHICQQHGFVHGGIVAAIADSASGYAALSLQPESAAVLTAEMKLNLMAPAIGDRLVAAGRVVKPGRTLTVALAEVFAECGDERRLIALMTTTMATVAGRADVSD